MHTLFVFRLKAATTACKPLATAPQACPHTVPSVILPWLRTQISIVRVQADVRGKIGAVARPPSRMLPSRPASGAPVTNVYGSQASTPLGVQLSLAARIV